MKDTPDKLYVVPMKTNGQDAFVGFAYELDKFFLEKTEYIRKETMLAWCRDLYEKYPDSHEIQTMIEKIQSM